MDLNSNLDSGIKTGLLRTRTPLKELTNRVQNLQAKLQENSLDGALIIENMDLFYLCGSMQQGFLFVPAEGEPLYMVRRNFMRGKEESGWQNILPLKSFKQLPLYLQEYNKQPLQKIGLEFDVLPVKLYLRLQKLFPGVEFQDVSTILLEIRMVKSPYEVSFYRQAAKNSATVFRRIPELLQIGKPEITLSSEIEALNRQLGHQGMLRMRAFNAEMNTGHVYSGQSGCIGTFLDSCTGGRGTTAACPQGAGWKPLAPHEPVCVDFSTTYEGYILDETRVFSIGHLPPELQKAANVAREIQETLASQALPGALCGDLYQLAQKIAARYGLEDYFMGYGDNRVKFVGHGVGLCLDEFPVFGQASPHILQPGMVFALEPKFSFPQQGVVGLENVWVVTKTGLEKLTLIPDEPVVVPY